VDHYNYTLPAESHSPSDFCFIHGHNEI
jgi:hypothetical protein